MKEFILAGDNSFESEEGKKFLLKYYIIKEFINKEIKKPLFGIAVYKYDITHNEVLIEKEESEAITYSVAIVKRMAEQLVKMTITPISMLEVLDDLVSEQLEECVGL